MYRKILVPLDGSTFAESALPLAFTLSRATGADVHLVIVLEPVSAYAYEGWASAAVEWSERYMEEARARVEGLAGGAVTTAVVTGPTVERLQDEARSFGADVIVMATHGRGALSRLWLGSVADGFVRQADRPVILVRPREGEDGKADGEKDFHYDFETLLIPLDGSELSECALKHATEFGELFDSAYHLTRVVPFPLDIGSLYLPHTVQLNQNVVDSAKQRAAVYLEERAERLRRRGFRVTTSVVVDQQPGHGVLSEAEAVGSDVIAMATRARKGLSRAMLGSAADKVLRGTDSPVLLFRPASVPD